ncbi:7TM diverse intracellular signaling domain-containing protein [Mucilaginibacter sp.]|uniref:sensor histidine kinase n=1 Tax=Mucilaginibacter sp. TaxID=1882438 RepID=UPI0026146B27|nr:7TM diverse intracellular signaling domain-containing protein [Mucilaginibacter sp.]MDB4926704.1 histidine kinase [Mucilaginibacter sp.]
MVKWLYILIFIFTSLQSKGELIVKNDNGRISLGKNLETLQPGKEINFAEAVKSTHFIAGNKDVPNMGFSTNSVWFRFTVTNKSDNKLLLEVAYPILDEVELYTSNGKSLLLGEVVDFNKRPYQYPNYIFNLDLSKGQTQTYYLRAKSTEQIILPITINQPESLWQNLSLENLIIGIYLGVVLIMVLYNLFIFFSVRDSSYLYYVIYVLFVGFTQIGIKGYTFQYLWPANSVFELKSVVLFACVSSIAALMFTKKFLGTKNAAPKSDIALTLLIGVFSVAILLVYIGKGMAGFQLMQASTTLLTIGVLSVSFMIMIKGSAPAKYFFIAWSILLTGAIVFLLKDYGVLPYNTFTSYSMQFASAIEMGLLSFGLADRINILKREKDASQAEALSIAKENERIIREQNVILELKVSERTYELNESLEDLKQTQSQLVESEKMASLGQLTAGIAHEINNPINFVTSNINPLKRDVEMILEAVTTIENISMSDASPADKKKQIEDYKEELDFDYLVEEVKHLIKGIYEGASRTAEIVKGLKIFSRLDEDDLKRADINEGLESTMVVANNLLNDKIKVIKEYSDLPLVESYAGKLNQVFLNIISNAIYAINKKFDDKEGGEIKISTDCDGESVIIKIADNGIGMNEQTIKKIFEPFFTTKEVGEGTGLGMSIAYNTIKKHNGQITVKSELNKGTEFILKIPIVFDTKLAQLS